MTPEKYLKLSREMIPTLSTDELKELQRIVAKAGISDLKRRFPNLFTPGAKPNHDD